MSTSPLQMLLDSPPVHELRKRVEFVPEEPGTLLILVVLFTGLLFAPGGVFSIGPTSDDRAAAEAWEVQQAEAPASAHGAHGGHH